MGVSFGWLTTYAAPQPSADFTYLFAAQDQPKDGPWIGAFAYSTQSQGTPGPLALSDIFALIAAGAPYSHVGFLVLPAAPDTTQMAAFRASMLQAASGGASGWVLWLPALGAFDATAPQLAFINKNAQGTWQYQLTTQPVAVLAAGGVARTLYVDPTNARNPALAAGGDGASLALTLAPGANIALSFGANKPATPAVSATSFTIPLTGVRAGCLIASGAGAAGLTSFELGFQFGMSTNSFANPSGRLVFPLLDVSETLSGATVTAAIDPLGLTPARSQLQIAPKGGTFLTAYRTALDETVAFAPGSTGAFVATTSLGGHVYFAPSGSFALSVPGSAESAHALLCGLSGVESITFQAGDLLGYQASADGGFSLATGAHGGFQFTPASSPACATAVATVTAGGATANAYRSEPSRAPFFSPDDASQPTMLTHNGLTLKTLPAAPPQGFPLLPYAAVIPVQGPGLAPGLVAAFESSWVTPTRSAVIEGYASGTSTAGAALGITPQGYIAAFDSQGGIDSLALGSSGPSSLTISGAGGASLPDPLRDALLAPQSFVVASCATAAYAANVQITLAMSGWSFAFAPPDAKNIAPGAYQSVLLIKSAEGTLVDLVASPSLWNGYALLNDTVTDPNGLMLSSWLSTYLAQALASWNNGTGPQGLTTFCELITDPDWNGFLCLNVPVATSQLDPALDFLLAGVDPSQLIAHHIGCAANQVQWNTAASAYQQDSAFFGYVHYLRPGAPPDGTVSAPFVNSNAPYDFQLMRLEAVFENSALVSFASMALLLLNNLFGDAVLPSASGPGPAATNTVIIDGTLQRHDGVPNYVFSTPTGMAATFYLSGAALDRTEIDRAIVAPNPAGGPGGPTNPNRSAVTFQLAGWLGMLPASIDLLSYAALPFSNLGLRMEFDTADGSNKLFTLDLADLALSPLKDAAVGANQVVTASLAAANVLYRADSLVSNFPLTLSQFITDGTQTPSDMGFLPLAVRGSGGGGGGAGALSAGWMGLQLDLPLGGSGSLDASGLIDATLLFAWMPGGQGTPAYSPFIKITGPGGVDLSFNLEGIIKFGAKGIMLSKVPGQNGGADVFVLEFASIALTIFTKSFPPGGSTNILVAGSPGRSLGWFGAYVDPTAPPLGSPPALQGAR
jgi:hypothetical protein